MVSKKKSPRLNRLVKAPAPVVAKDPTYQSQNVATWHLPDEKRFQNEAKRSKKTMWCPKKKPRRQEGSVLDVMEDSEIITLEETKAFEQEKNPNALLCPKKQKAA